MLMSQGSRATAGSNNLSGKDRFAWEAGIRLFELVYNKRDTEGYKKQIMGAYAVKVDEDTSFSGNEPKYREKWLTGLDACIEYKPVGERGVLIAYMPDDRWYHNRVVLLDTPTLVVNGLLTRDHGDISRAEALVQIQCLREVICEQRDIFKIVNAQGVEKDFFWTEQEAIDFINLKETQLIGLHAVPREVQPNIRLKIVKGLKFRKKPEIERLIAQYKGLQYGWTSCDEFLKGYVPKVQTLIKERTRVFRGVDASTSPANLQAAILDALSTFSPEQISALRQQAEERKAAAVSEPVMEIPQEQPESEDPGAPLTEDGVFSRFRLSRMKKETLAGIAEKKGVTIAGLDRPAIIDAILQTQGQPEVAPTILN